MFLKVISYSGIQATNGTAEIQNVKILSPNSNDFVLNFDGANTSILILFKIIEYNNNYYLFSKVAMAFGSSASIVQKALNDLPTLETDVVTVSSQGTADGGILYTITFTPSRGDVPAINETSGNVVATVTETVKGVASQLKFQLSVNNAWSNLFDYVNDPVQTVIKKENHIKTPQNIYKSLSNLDIQRNRRSVQNPLSTINSKNKSSNYFCNIRL
jgi:hypothetical protein